MGQLRISDAVHLSHCVTPPLILLALTQRRSVTPVDALLVLLGIKIWYDFAYFLPNPTELLSRAALVAGIILMASAVLRLREGRRVKSRLTQSYILFSLAHALLLVAQFVEFNALGSTQLLNPLGGFSPIGPNPVSDVPTPYNPELQAVHRPNGLAWEPSVAGLWALLGWAVVHDSRVVVGGNEGAAKIVLALGIAATFSVVVWVGFAAVWLYTRWALVKRSGEVRGRLLASGYIVIALGALVAGMPYVLERLGEVSVEGSSGYIRVTAPVMIAREIGLGFLGNTSLTGAELRSVASFPSAGRTMLGGVPNTYFQIILYFGLAGVVAVALYVVALTLWTAKRGLAIGVALLWFPLGGGYLFNIPAILPALAALYFASMGIRSVQTSSLASPGWRRTGEDAST